MKLDTIKLLQESFNVSESVAKRLMGTLDPQIIAALVAEKLGGSATVEVKADPKAKKAPAKKVTGVELVRSALASYVSGSPVTPTDIAEATGMPRRSVNDYLYKMYEKGEIESKEVGVYITKK